MTHTKDTPKETWEKEFYELFVGKNRFRKDSLFIHRIKAFISQEIAQARKEGYDKGRNDAGAEKLGESHEAYDAGKADAVREVVKEICDIVKDSKGNYPLVNDPEWRRGYTEALDDLLATLKQYYKLEEETK